MLHQWTCSNHCISIYFWNVWFDCLFMCNFWFSLHTIVDWFKISATLEKERSAFFFIFIIINCLCYWSTLFQRAEHIVKSHDASNGPLFLYMAFQNVHSPVQAPKQHVNKYSFINDTTRRTYAGMVDIMDEAVGNITGAFKEAGYVYISLFCK